MVEEKKVRTEEVVRKQIIHLLNKELTEFSKHQIKVVLDLLADGNTVPFIARYRKEVTGTLDELAIQKIDERHQYLTNLEKRKTEILNSIEEQDELTEELEKKILKASKLQRLEDLYLPYRKKRRTLAMVAKEKGLEPLADWLKTFPELDIKEEARKYINPEEELETVEDVLAGAHEILAESTSDSAKFRSWIRHYTLNKGYIQSEAKDEKKDKKGVFQIYYDFKEPLKKLASHQILALNRGEKEEVLTAKIRVDEERIYEYLFEETIPETALSGAIALIQEANEDSYKRFIQPAIERELRSELTEEAEDQAINVFGENLRNLLLQAPLKNKRILGFDPAYRTGCKLAAIDETGKVLGIGVIFPHKPASAKKRAAAKDELIDFLKKYKIDTIAIGNGTASRESEKFVSDILKEMDKEIAYAIVNEAGASVYSASKEARREFPDLNVEERSAASIARRIQDPLAELVKIDPKSIGVGQYQHDVSQKKLNERLDFVVETAVNQVGVDLNTASSILLGHVSGLTKTTAQNIVNYREENKLFTTRKQLKDVKRLGPKSFEQSAGFLRVADGEEIFDRTGIHPESYKEAEEILKILEIKKEELGSEEASEQLLTANAKKIREEVGLGKETYQDIIKSMTAPGRDVRDEMAAPLLRTDVLTIEDLTVGMELKGTVRNVVDFGAFVDIGVGQDGLVHISKLSQDYVKHPKEKVAVGDTVTVWVDSVEVSRERIGLTMVKGKE
ncbi:MAG: RNA-binding transcriptional accessory protein [Atopostipes suicloacalis]|nr:RNA-binding transcriptional accessory protein [Atopostipes suicloacalis]MDN6730920.1 RNA-binding transcriptional accessory protein [Atopostipes suicloacalis]